jgi:hypothetical protein
MREATPGPGQCVIEIPHIRQICGKDDFPPLRAHDTICDREESVQILITFGTRPQQVIRIFHYERVVPPRDESHKNLIALHGLFVASVERGCMPIVSPSQRSEDAADEPRFPGPRWTLQHQNCFRGIQIPLDEISNATRQVGVCGIQYLIVSQLFDALAQQVAAARLKRAGVTLGKDFKLPAPTPSRTIPAGLVKRLAGG